MDLNEALVAACLEQLDVPSVSIGRTDEFVPTEYADSPLLPDEYYQVFKSKHGFLPDLSIIDLIFNMGPESILFLHKSTNKNN